MRSLIHRLADYINGRYISRFWVLFIDTIVSSLSTVLVYLALNYFAEGRLLPFSFLEVLGMSLVASVLAFLLFRTYKGILRHTTMREMWRISFASVLKGFLGTLQMFLALILFRNTADSSQFLVFALTDVVFTLFMLILVRVFLTNLYDLLLASRAAAGEVKNILVYGDDDESVATYSFLEKSQQMKYRVVGFLRFDGVNRTDSLLCGLRVHVVNDEKSFSRLLQLRKVEALIFPNNVSAKKEQNRLVSFCVHRHIQVLIRPSMAYLGEGLSNTKVREIKIEDLLGRDEIRINEVEIREFLTDKVVFVTGGAGSIGGQLCRLLVNMPIRKLVLIDTAETPMHNMQLELRSQAPKVEKKFIVSDVRSLERMDFLFSKYRPNVVFHAAAYKHVPLMESNPTEAVQANVFGTMNVVNCSVKHNVEKFVMISTDKAVNPTNVMGASKRIAEIYVQTLGREIAEGRMKGRTRFITTRFGNVLGSNGSVIPLFKEQIAKGGPVTVTDPRIIRYFMTIPEACRLVLEAATLGQGNDIFVFDMGDPVKIDDLAKNMISLAGLELGKDIEIEYVGLRPGEKLYEELLKDEENTLPTSHEKIFRAKVREFDFAEVQQKLEKLRAVALTMRKDDTVAQMKAIVPEFISANSRYGRLDEPEK